MTLFKITLSSCSSVSVPALLVADVIMMYVKMDLVADSKYS